VRTRIIAGNWKMNKTVSEALSLVRGVLSGLKGREDLKIVLCPPFTALGPVGEALEGTQVELGAQNVYPEDSGARTGEISPPMLKELGVTYVIAGHSERRKYFGENEEVINRKVKAILGTGLIPIMCFGETLEDREAGRAVDVVLRQLRGGFAGIDSADRRGVILAYEPVWAIGTGRNASPEDVEEMHGVIRGDLGVGGADTTILYGGSVKPDNVQEITAREGVDGGLIGGASLVPDSFLGIIENAFRRS
jgi:triosephosphate isomerase